MKTAQDIMTKDLLTIQSGQELSQCLSFFLEHEIHYAPVVTPLGEVLGMLSEFGLVKAALRHHLDSDKQEIVYTHKDLLEQALVCMPTDSIEEVAKAVMKSPTHRVLVMTPQKRLVGIISPKDILHLLSGEAKKKKDVKVELEAARLEAEKLHQRMITLEESLSRYQELLDNAPQMIHGVDENGKIVIANARLHESLDYKPNSLIGKDVTILYPQSVHHEVIEGLKRLVNSQDHFSTYSSMVKREGGKIRVDLASSVLRDKHGKFLHTITICREVDSEALLRALHGVLLDKNETTGS